MNHDQTTAAAVALCVLAAFVQIGCSDEANGVQHPDGGVDAGPKYPDADREQAIPQDATKRGSETDEYPPILHTEQYDEPVALPYPVNTAGAEDSPFVLPDGRTLYFFFTPDVRVPPQEQILDQVTGIWVTHRQGEGWSRPERVWLQDPDKLALDGAVFVQDDEMWFASIREGYEGVNMFTAKWRDGGWRNWTYVGDLLMKEIQIGEVHLHGDDLYFHSARAGGLGQYDIWLTRRTGSSWSDPVNLQTVNSDGPDAYPFVTSDGEELWFTRQYRGSPAIYRSTKQEGQWTDPELMVSQFAGEPTLDDAGNLYFVHHFYENGTMIEADIYVARRKR